MKAPVAPAVEEKLQVIKAKQEDASERLKRLKELVRARFAEDAAKNGGASALKAWLASSD
jgi:hypothetical protein